MKSKKKLITRVTYNNTTVNLPKALKIDSERFTTAEGLLIEILRLECEALTGEKIPYIIET